MSDEREEIRSRIDIVELVGQTVQLKKAGRDWKGLCPFHDDTSPSFTVSQRIGRYRCWSCGANGDIFNWVMETQKLDFPQALEVLAKRAGVSLKKRKVDPEKESQKKNQSSANDLALKFFLEEYKKSEVAQKYTKGRNLSKEMIQKWEIGFAPSQGEALAVRLNQAGFSLLMCQELFLVEKDQQGGYYDRFRSRLIFPIRDERGTLVAFGGRIIGDGNPKYINSSDTPLYRKSKVLYGMYQGRDAISKSRHMILVEGYTDVIACHSAGLEEAVATLGTSLAEDHVRLIKRWCEEVTILYDQDQAGIKAADRACEMLLEAGLRVKVALMPEGEDPDTLLQTKGASAVQQSTSHAKTPVEFRLWSLEQEHSADEDAYWQEVVKILSGTTELEREKYLHSLASKYPGIQDKAAARRALQSMVQNYQKGMKSRPVHKTKQGEDIQVKKSASSELNGLEKVVIATLESEYKYLVIEFVCDSENFSSPLAKDLSEKLNELSSEKPLQELNLLNELQGTEHEQILVELVLADEVPISEEAVNDAMMNLKKKRNEREVQSFREGVQSDDDLIELTKRLKSLKNP